MRDQNGQIVISHDCPENQDLPTFEELLVLYQKYQKTRPLALNVKADGLQEKCRDLLVEYKIDLENIFFFDMSVPDALNYLKYQLPCFSRYSDEEPVPSFLDRATGVWIDGFETDCVSQEVLLDFLAGGHRLCLVSPELHKRKHQEVWGEWREMLKHHLKSVMICTDFPDLAYGFFNDEN